MKLIMIKDYKMFREIVKNLKPNKLLVHGFLIVVFSFLSIKLEAQVVLSNTDVVTIPSGTTATSISMSYDPGTDNNRFMIVAVTTSRRDVFSATFGGDPMTLLGNVVNGNSRVVFFTLSDPPSGTATLQATLESDDRGFVMGVATFSNVDLNNPLNTFSSATGSSNTASIASVPTSPGSIVFSAVSHRDSRDNFLTFGTGQDSIWAYRTANSNDRHNSAGSTKVISSGTTTSVSYTHPTRSTNWSIGAVSVNAIPEADLEVVISVNDSFPFFGQKITFEIIATNNGPSNAVDVFVESLIASGFSYLSHTASEGDYNPLTGQWLISTLNNGISETLEIEVLVNNSGLYTQDVSISSSSIEDNVLGNNDDDISITICLAGGQRPLLTN